MRYVLPLLLAFTGAPAAQTLGDLAPGPIGGLPIDGLAALADTTEATAEASLRVEHARLALARHELRAATHWSRLRPQIDLYVSVSTRGLAFPSISTQGYDPAYAAIARWPGDSWGVTASWTLDQLLDKRPAHRARAAVAVAEARVDLHHARQDARRERDAARATADARREADRQRREAEALQRTRATRTLLASDAHFLQKRLDAQRELLRLAEMTYEQGETDYTALARARLAVLDAERAVALNAARLDALADGLSPADLALAAPPQSAPDAD